MTAIERIFRRAAYGALAAGVLAVCAAPAVLASSSGRPTQRATFGIQPVTNGHLDQRAQIELSATPGAVATDHVAVVNYSNQRLQLRVYATDAVDDDKGNLTLLPTTRKPSEAGTWISLATPHDRGVVSLPARSRIILAVRVHVPVGAAPGDHLAGIVAQLDTQSRNKQLQVRLQQRVGARVLFHIAGAVRPHLQIRHLRTSYGGPLSPVAAGTVHVSYQVVNTGNVILSATQSVSAHGWIGPSVTTLPAAVTALLPGSSVTVHATLTGVWPGLRDSVRANVVPRPIAGAALPAVTSSVGFWAVPWGWLALIALLTVVAVLAWWRHRRRPPRAEPGRHRGSRPLPHPAPPMEEIRT